MAGNQWPLIRAERVALIGDLENLSDAQWSTQSLCSAWTVRDVLAHMTTTAKMTPGRFFGRFAGTGFQFNAMNEKGVKEELGATPADTLAGFKAQLDRTTAPPGPLDAMVGEVVIHGQDIRRPLGIAHTYQPEALTLVGDFVIRGNLLLGGKRRATGLTLGGHRRRLDSRRRARGPGTARVDHPGPHRTQGRPCRPVRRRPPDLERADLTGAKCPQGSRARRSARADLIRSRTSADVRR